MLKPILNRHRPNAGNRHLSPSRAASNSAPASPPVRTINAAIVGFEQQKRRIDDQIAELRAMLPGGRTEAAAAPRAPGRKRRKFSAAAIQRMREAQQRRWANIRGKLPAPAKSELAKPKRKLAAAAKAKLVANLKKARAAKAAKAKAAGK